MNNTDRRKLERIYNCLKIPGCNFGGVSQSASFHGVAGYAKDMYYALPKIQHLLYLVGTDGECYEGEWEEMMVELEEWLKKRTQEGWE